MKKDQEILDDFGKRLIQECFDPCYGNASSLRKMEQPPQHFKEYSEFLKGLSDEEFAIFNKYLSDRLGSLFFNFLRFFEENEDYKLIYQVDKKQINLVEISESLKAEPIIENGWITRFSKTRPKGK